MYFLPIIIAILLVFLIYFFAKWEIRLLMLKNVANRLGIKFSNDKGNVYLNGTYKNREIRIMEGKTNMPSMEGGSVTAKKMQVFVNERLIFEKEGEIIFPFPKKMIRSIDNYIENGSLPKKSTSAAWILVAILFILLIVAQFFR